MPFQGNDGRWHEREDTRDADNAARARVSATDWGGVEARLRAEAKAKGLEYHESDLEDIRRNYGYDRPSGSLSELEAAAFKKYGERAPQVGDGGSGDGDGGGAAGYGDYPYPERVAMPDPTLPTPYFSGYTPEQAQAFTGVGQADRNRLLQSILQSPETMGATQQAQLFEQQKELLNAQRQQQLGQLEQNLVRSGLSDAGGRALAGQMDIGQDFSGQLLASQRDIAVKAATQNRADTMAALQMQQAIAEGDSQRAMEVYRANQAERTNTENFLRQAADLRQSAQLTYNAQRLAQATAQQNEISDFYSFLENQRRAAEQLNFHYWSTPPG